MKRKPRLTDAEIKARIASSTLGPCSCCEWPITHTCKGVAGNMNLYCDLCDGLTRDFPWRSVNDPVFYVI